MHRSSPTFRYQSLHSRSNIDYQYLRHIWSMVSFALQNTFCPNRFYQNPGSLETTKEGVSGVKQAHVRLRLYNDDLIVVYRKVNPRRLFGLSPTGPRPPGTRVRARTPSLAPWWGPSCAIPGGVTVPVVMLSMEFMQASLFKQRLNLSFRKTLLSQPKLNCYWPSHNSRIGVSVSLSCISAQVI